MLAHDTTQVQAPEATDPPKRVPGGSLSQTRDAQWERPALLHQIRHRMGARLRASCEPEDLLQDAFLAALESGRAQVPSQLTRAWIWTLARLRIRTLLAQARPSTQPWRTTALPPALIALDSEAMNSAKTDREVPDHLQERELAERGCMALHCLSFEERACLVLRDFFGLGWTAIAKVIERSPDTARKVHGRAAATVRRTLRRMQKA